MKKILKITMPFILILVLIYIVNLIKMNEEPDLNKRVYSNLDNYYSYEKLDDAYIALTYKLNDQDFIMDQLDLIYNDNSFDIENVSIIDGFFIPDNHNLSLKNYSTLSKVTEKKYDDIPIIDFDDNDLPRVTYLSQLYTCNVVPIIVFTYEYENYRYDLSFTLDNNEQWIIIDLK